MPCQHYSLPAPICFPSQEAQFLFANSFSFPVQSLFPPSAPSLPPLLRQPLSLYFCCSPLFSLYSGLIVLVLPYWNWATCARLSGCHRRDFNSRGGWFCGTQEDSSTIPGRMTELWCQAEGLSPSHQQHGLWEWELWDFLCQTSGSPWRAIQQAEAFSPWQPGQGEAANSTSSPGHSHSSSCSKHGQAGAARRRGFRDLAARPVFHRLLLRKP